MELDRRVPRADGRRAGAARGGGEEVDAPEGRLNVMVLRALGARFGVDADDDRGNIVSAAAAVALHAVTGAAFGRRGRIR